MLTNRLGIAAAVAVVLVAVASGALLLLARTPSSGVGGPSPTPTHFPLPPTASPAVTAAPTARPTFATLDLSEVHASDLYLYQIDYPTTWSLTAGTDPNYPDYIPDLGQGQKLVDFYDDSTSGLGLLVTSAPLSADRPDLARWSAFIAGEVKRKFGGFLGGTCTQSTRTLALGGEPANEVDFFCPGNDWLWVTAVHAGRGYQVAWLADGGYDAATLRPPFDQILQTFTFTN